MFTLAFVWYYLMCETHRSMFLYLPPRCSWAFHCVS